MNEFRRCLIDLDVAAIIALWPVINPGQKLKGEGDALIALHYARTVASSVPFALRAYSHKWLTERSLPSGLPDELKPNAERLYPTVVEAVGVSVKAMSAASIPLAKAMEKAMSDAVEDAYAEGHRDPIFIKARMEEARLKVIRS